MTSTETARTPLEAFLARAILVQRQVELKLLEKSRDLASHRDEFGFALGGTSGAWTAALVQAQVSILEEVLNIDGGAR
jgi:hypothetical protein